MKIHIRILPYTCCMCSRCRVVFLPFILPSFCRRVVFLHVFVSVLFLHILQVHPYLKQSFTENFPLVFVIWGGISKPNRTCFEIQSLLLTSEYTADIHNPQVTCIVPYYIIYKCAQSTDCITHSRNSYNACQSTDWCTFYIM